MSHEGGWNEKRSKYFLFDKMSGEPGQRYSGVMEFIMKIVRFDLLRTTVIALRGERRLEIVVRSKYQI